jgi:hypothetical protein
MMMAKLTVELDTKTNEATVSVDGVKVENVSYVSISNYGSYYDSNGDGDFHFCVDTREKVGDVSKCVSLCASEKGSAKASEKYPGLFEKHVEDQLKTKAGFEIAEMFTKGRKVK